MRLAWYHIISFIGLSILCSCAQIGTIEGGPRDENPPRIQKSSIPNGSTSFNKKSIDWEFDEYFQLNSPQNTISLTPNHSRIKTSFSGKKFHLEFLDSLHSNTTYQLILNGTIKDINEGNDSLMVFAFSTGPTLDQSSYTTRIIDAFTSLPAKKIFVGLFDSTEINPVYLQKTDEQGAASFTYIKSGEYSVKAWDDVNISGKYDSSERVAFRLEKLIIKDTIVDTIPMLLAKPELNKVIRKAQFIEPGLVSASVNISDDNYNFSFLGNVNISKENLIWKGEDSVLIPFNSKISPSTQLFVSWNNQLIDSLRINSVSEEEIKSFKIKPVRNWILSNETLDFEIPDIISSVDSTKILVQNKASKDTLRILSMNNIGNLLRLSLEKNDAKEYEILFPKESITGKTNLKSEKCKFSIPVYSNRELGVLLVNVSKLEATDLVQLIQVNKVIESFKKDNKQQLEFKDLIPGEYSFRVIKDKNNNSRWDGWELETKSEPEKVIWFSEPIKVRANWEIKTELVPKNE